MHMAQPLPHYLRTHRLGTGLTQDEIAFLLGASDGSRISRYESFKRLPELSVALAYGAVHQEPVQQLFQGRYLQIAAGVLVRARELRENLASEPADKGKVEILSTMILVLERGFDL